MRVLAQKQNKSISQLLATVVSFGLFFYFFYHLMHGERGYFALRGMEEQLQASQMRYEHVLHERQSLENRVKMLRPDSLDLDLLDERARVVLGFMRSTEKSIIDNP